MPEAAHVWGNYTLHQFPLIGEALKDDILWKGNMEMIAFYPRNLLPLQADIVSYGIIPGEQVDIKLLDFLASLRS